MNTESRLRINQGVPGLRSIAGRAWHKQNGQKRWWQDQAGLEAGTWLEARQGPVWWSQDL